MNVLTGILRHDGKDTAVIAAKQKDITVTVQKDAAVLVDDRTGAEGQDALHNIETLQFADGESLDLEGLQNILTLAEGDLMRLVELYVAYFDRAPDAQGLFFWADCLAGGMSFADIAGHFYDQPETLAKYGDGSDPALLVAQVYENCLGCTPDAAGLLFWTSKLDSGEVEPAGFILAVIDGAKAASGSAADADFFAAKASIGAYFAVQMGMTDNVVGQAVLSEFDGSADSLLQAREMVEDAYDLASGAEDGTLLIQLVGLIEDPFAGL